MGIICSMCCCCCPWFQEEEEEEDLQSNKLKKDRVSKGNSPKVRFRVTDEDIETDDMAETLDPGAMATFKAGESAYSIQKRRFFRPNKASPNKTGDQEIIDFLNKNTYVLHQKLGSGSYSEVYRISKKHKNYALKVIDLRKVNLDYKQNFLGNEIGILKKIQANKMKYIIRIYEVSSTKNKVMIVMEFAPNGTLADYLVKDGALNETAAQSWFTKILEAIEYLHNIGVAHRDLKLENILLNKKLRPKISDFSYAIEVKPDSPLSKQFCGSIPYFPPEILQHKPHNPLKADIWALGVCFYIMLNDKLPFNLDDENIMLKQQLTKDWKYRKNVEPNLSPELKDMIASMLEPEVDRRATAQSLATHPWFVSYKERKNAKT